MAWQWLLHRAGPRGETHTHQEEGRKLGAGPRSPPGAGLGAWATRALGPLFLLPCLIRGKMQSLPHGEGFPDGLWLNDQ